MVGRGMCLASSHEALTWNTAGSGRPFAYELVPLGPRSCIVVVSSQDDVILYGCHKPSAESSAMHGTSEQTACQKRCLTFLEHRPWRSSSHLCSSDMKGVVVC